MNILKLKVEKFFEFFLHLFDFIIFLLDSLFALRFYIIYCISKTRNFFIFLLSDFLDSIFYYSFNVLFFVNNFSEASDLELVFFLFVIELSFECFDLSFDFKSLFILNFKNHLHFWLFSFFSSLPPSIDLVLHFMEFGLPIGWFGLLFLGVDLNLLDFGFGFTELFVLIVNIWL